MARCLSLRFDVDTELCLREGVPRLLALGADLDCRFTFFVNPGRAISRGRLISDAFRKRHRAGDHRAPHLSSIKKLGLRELMNLVVRNPKCLPRHGSVVRQAWEQGHEIGLHGGRNHALWQRDADQWGTRKIQEEVAWGRSMLESCGIPETRAFASPGWNGPENLPEVLEREGFTIWADAHGTLGQPELTVGYRTLTRVPTAFTGEPGGVGFVEHRRARGDDDKEILRDLSKFFASETPFLCLYDHPFYAGRFESELIGKIITLAREFDREIMPVGDVVNHGKNIRARSRQR